MKEAAATSHDNDDGSAPESSAALSIINDTSSSHQMNMSTCATPHVQVPAGIISAEAEIVEASCKTDAKSSSTTVVGPELVSEETRDLKEQMKKCPTALQQGVMEQHEHQALDINIDPETRLIMEHGLQATCTGIQQDLPVEEEYHCPAIPGTSTFVSGSPGAYPIQARGEDDFNLLLVDDEQQQQSRPSIVIGELNSSSPPPATISLRNSQDGLAIANLVVEDEESIPTVQLPRAQAAENVGMRANLSEDQKTKRFGTYSLVGIIMLCSVVILVLLMAVLGSTRSNKEESVATGSPTASPTLAPTSIKDSFLSLLPDDTVLTTQQDPTSPQALALQWLLEDVEYYGWTTTISNDRIRQRFALATLHYATSGAGWTKNDGWLDHHVHECQWAMTNEFAMKSVISSLYPGYLDEFQAPTTRCSISNGLYQHLWLDQLNLVGTIPPELYMLTSLKTLSCGFNKLDSSISTLVGQLTDLEALVFAYLENGGEIPSEIGLLTKLTSLGLPSNGHHAIPTEIWGLTNLETLFFNFNLNLWGSIPTEIANMSNLRFLSCSNCAMSGTIPSEIGQLEKLEWITLEQNEFSGRIPSELGELSKLSVLSLFGNALESTIPSELGQLTSTTVLTLRNNLLTGTLPSEIGKLQNLTISMVLRNNSFSGPIPSEFGLLTGLREISLEFNDLSGTIPTELVDLQANPTFHSLKLDGNFLLSGTVPPSLCSINGTCIPNSFDPCGEPYEITFDCTGLLCGCHCPCL